MFAANAERRRRDTRGILVIAMSFVSGLVLCVAIATRDPFAVAAACVVVVVVGAFAAALYAWEASRDRVPAEIRQTEGRVALSYELTRSGRVWTVKVGDRVLSVFDDVGLRLANMPWGIVEYTPAGHIVEVTDLDGAVVYSWTPRSEAAVTRHPFLVGGALAIGWVALGFMLRAAR